MIYPKPQSKPFAADAPASEIKDFTAWLRGLGIAFDETNGFPEMTGFNGLLNALSMYIKYLEQNGFAEWRDDLEYPIGAGVRVGAIWYRAIKQNTAKPPATSQNEWELFLNATAVTYEDPIYIENRVVKIRDATQQQKGVMQFATAQEAQAGAKVSKAITPDQAMLTSFGFGQKRIDVTKDRTLLIEYRNDTPKPIEVSISAIGQLTLYVDDIIVAVNGDNSWINAGSKPTAFVCATVQPNSKYKLGSFTNYLSGTLRWTELR